MIGDDYIFLEYPRVSRHPTSWLAISVSRWVSGFLWLPHPAVVDAKAPKVI
jgi:hypothetical protein